MKQYGLNELRKMFLDFFESKGHLVMKSFSLVPHNDNSLLLINAEWQHVISALEQVISKISEKLQDTVHFLKCLVTSLLVIILKEKQFIGHGSF